MSVEGVGCTYFVTLAVGEALAPPQALKFQVEVQQVHRVSEVKVSETSVAVSLTQKHNQVNFLLYPDGQGQGMGSLTKSYLP